MYKPLILIVLLLSSSFAVLDVSSIGTDEEEQYVILPNETNEEKPRQLAINYMPFKEIATIMIDQTTNKMKKSYSLLSKDKEDFQIPDSLEAKILGTEKIVSIIYTSEEKCAPTHLFFDATCILINIPYSNVEGASFKEKQQAAREIGDSVIDDVNLAFFEMHVGTYVEFHSVAVQTDYGLTNEEEAVLSVVYTMHNLPSKLLFNMFIIQNITDEIRMTGGFFNHAKDLSVDENSEFKFSMIVEPTRILYSLHLSVISSDNEIELDNFSPLDLLHVDKLNRSKLFADGFYPLNSIVHVIIYSEEQLQVIKTSSEVIGSMGNANELQKNGWYFISNKLASDDEINKLDLRYLFGKTNSVDKQQLLLSIVPVVENVTPSDVSQNDVSQNDVSQNDVSQNDVSQNGGGCLIATAAFGSEMAPQVQFLREIRDNTVLQTESGSTFMTGFNQFYYSFSPYIADYERENPTFKETVKLALTPLLTSLTLLQYTDIDSESEMLGYGIGVILLNIGMYFVAPAILVMKIRKLIEKPHLKN